MCSIKKIQSCSLHDSEIISATINLQWKDQTDKTYLSAITEKIQEVEFKI